MRVTFVWLIGGAALAALATPASSQDQMQQPNLPTITVGQTVQGQIAAPVGGCATNPRVRAWRFEGRADQRIEITMQSEDFDTLLELGRMSGCEFQSLASNDDGAGPEDGLNSRLSVRLRENGTYVVRAMSFSDDGSGPFTLAIRQLPPPPPEPAPRPLSLGNEVRGQLTNTDATISTGEEEGLAEGGRPYHYYTLTGAAGDRIRLELDSNEFDPVLEAGSLSPLGYSMAQYNDDGGGPEDGLNSRLTVTFRSAGTIVLRVSPLGNDVGAYRLRANRASSSQ
jgi:hypothetical protein